jgi:SAM-dependent methyltransferase
MESKPADEEIEAARAYEALHVPALFQQWAPRVADAARIQPGQRVLDLACGTGALAREVAARVGDDGAVAGLDPSRGMLFVAESMHPSATWHEGTAESLPFEDASFDAVVSQFGLMFFRDRAAALNEMMRVLVPGGRFAVAVWASLDDSEAYPIEVELLDRLAGRHAGDALRAPFVLGDADMLKSMFDAANAMSVEVTARRGRARFPSIRTMVEADLRGWLPVMGVSLTEDQVRNVLAEAEVALGRYVTSEGAVEFEAPALIVTGEKPQPT